MFVNFSIKNEKTKFEIRLGLFKNIFSVGSYIRMKANERINNLPVAFAMLLLV